MSSDDPIVYNREDTEPRESIGTNVTRQEGVPKLTGDALYADDLDIDDCLHGATIRSEVARGQIQDIVFEDGIPWDEFTIVLPEDIPGENTIHLIKNEQPFLCEDEIKHKAEPVALIAHPDKHMVEKARDYVRVEVDQLPAMFTIEEAQQKETVQYGDDNITSEYEVMNNDPEDVWDDCDYVFEQEYRTGSQEQLYIEPQAMIARTEPSEAATIWGTLQCPYYIRDALAPLLAIDEDNVRVIQTETGGGFGGKEEYPNMIAGHAALLSWKAGGQPVRLVYDRREDLRSTPKRHPSKTTIKAGFSEDGELLGLDIDFNLNTGGYPTLTSTVLSRGILHSWGPYQCEHVRAHARAYMTNSNPYGAMRGFGAPQSIFAMEQHMNRCAYEMDMDPAELRRRNLYEQGDCMPTGQEIEEDIDLEFMLDRALKKANYHQRKEQIEQFNREHNDRKKGISLSFFFHGSGFTGSGEEWLDSELEIQLQEDGGVEILAGQVEYGQGTITAFSQIASETLGIPPEWVSKHQPDTAEVPDSGPTVASRTTMVVGKLVERASNKLLTRLRNRTDLGEDHTPEEFQEAVRRYVQEHDDNLRTGVKYKQPEEIFWDDENYQGSAYSGYSWTCDVAEVEVDLVEYFPTVENFVSIVECGNVLNPILAAGQIEGGIAQAIGFAIYEDVRIEEGEMQNAQYTNYIIPTTADTPDIDVQFVEFPHSNYGPYQAKGIGELPIDGPAPAITGAVSLALNGTFLNEIPMIPERVMDALEGSTLDPAQAEVLA